jgi:putative endonuclease
LVSKSCEAFLGAAGMAFWAGVDNFIRHHRRDFRSCVLESFQRKNFLVGRFALRAQLGFQFRFFSDSVWTPKQSSGGSGYPFGSGHARLGAGRNISSNALGRLCQCPISSVGAFCDNPAADDYVFELVIFISAMYFLYILECADKTLYTGITTDLERRIVEHNEKLGAKYTSARRPVKLKFCQKFKNRSAASKAESRIKKLKRSEKLELIGKSQKKRINQIRIL